MLDWTRPERCESHACVEVARDPLGTRYVRDSKDPHLFLAFAAEEWRAFEDSIRAGQRF